MFDDNQQSIDFNLYSDYVFIDGVTVTFKMVQEFIDSFQEDINKSTNKIRFITFHEDSLREDAFKLTNLLSEVGSNLTRGYYISRMVKAYRTKFLRQYEELTNKELSDGMNQKTKDLRQATLANKYKMLYMSIQALNDFIDNELLEYINEMTVAKDILSRQIASLEIEFKLASL